MKDSRLRFTLSADVYEKRTSTEILNREFSQFGQTEIVQPEKTVEDFFKDYEEIYFKIPINGSVNSHQYLVEKSSELYKKYNPVESLQPLLDEITQLKAQAVLDKQTILDLQIKLNNSAAD